MSSTAQADPPGRALPRREQHHGLERPAAGSHIEFSSFVHLAQTAERAKFDFLFLAEGLRLREQNGQIYDLDVVGRPGHLHRAGRAGRGDRPARAGRHDQLHLQRALRGGPPVRQPRPPVRRPGGVERGHLLGRLHRRELPPRRLPAAGRSATSGPGRSWPPPGSCSTPGDGDEIVADQDVGVVPAPSPTPGAFGTTTTHFDIAGQFNVPRSPQGRPVIFQAGDSDEGREFAASSADAIFSRHSTLEAGQAFYADVKGRLARYGRAPDELLILPAATFVLGDTDAEAAGAGPRGSPAAGQRADRDQASSSSCGTGTCPATTRTARCPDDRPRARREHHRPRPGQRAHVPRPAGHGRGVARPGRGREASRSAS